MLLFFEKSKQKHNLYCYFCDQNYFMIFAALSIVQASLTLLSLIAKINQKSPTSTTKQKKKLSMGNFFFYSSVFPSYILDIWGNKLLLAIEM